MADDADGDDGGKPFTGRLFKTERSNLMRDDREARVQDPGTKLYTKPPDSTPSLTNMRRTLPSRALVSAQELPAARQRSLASKRSFGGKR